MHVTTLSTQLGLGSELVDRYRDATSVPSGHLLIDLSPRTDDRLRYCTNTGCSPLKFFYPGPAEAVKNFGRWTHQLSTLEVFQSFSHKCKILFPQSWPKEFIRFLCECIMNLLKGNLQRIKRHQVAKFQNDVRLLFLKRTTWKQRRDILACERELQLIKVIAPPVINHLFWYGAVCSRSCLCTTKIWLPSHLQSRNFQCINLHKVPRTKFCQLKRR